MQMRFEPVDLTGARVIVPLTPLGHAGPKHHAIVIGRCLEDGQVYVAQSQTSGYGMETLEGFKARHADRGEIVIRKNNGQFSDVEVARRALDELSGGGAGPYRLLTNNCESFSNRAMYGHSVSGQVVRTVLGAAALIAGVWLGRRFPRG